MAKLRLSVIASDLRGRAGNVIVSRSRYGLAVRPYVVPNDPKTPAQIESRNRFAFAASLYKTLDPEQIAAWIEYANKRQYNDAITGKQTSQTAVAAFTALTTKFLQIQSALDAPPIEPPPMLPPSSDLEPDSLQLQATAIEGAIRITASANNSENVYTEILLQPLPSWGRAPKRHLYKTAAFIHFTAHQPADIPAQPGITAIAYRFAKSTTGQQTELTPLTTIQID